MVSERRPDTRPPQRGQQIGSDIMSSFSRRTFTLGALASTSLAACSNGIGGGGAEMIDGRVGSTLDFMYANYPGTRDLANTSAGMLVMPLVTEVGLGLGGSFGRGALIIGQSTVDYYSSTA